MRQAEKSGKRFLGQYSGRLKKICVEKEREKSGLINGVSAAYFYNIRRSPRIKTVKAGYR